MLTYCPSYTYISKSNYKIKLLGLGRVEVQSLTTPEFTIKISYKMVRLLEADEILAIILHELGHNYHMLRVLFEGEKAVRYEDLRKRMSKQYGFFSGPLGIIFGIILGASIIGAPLLLMLLMQSGQLLHIRTNYLKGEIPADDFAVMHKLGGPLATGLKKVIFEAYHKNDQKFDKIGGLLNKFRVMKSIFSFNIDDILNERAIFILNSLEEQLNSTKKIAPEEEKNLREQIKNVREVITDRSFRGKVKEIKERLFSDETQALIMRRAGLISETTSSDIEAFPYGIYFDFSEAKAEIDFLKSNERLLSLEEMNLLNQLNEAVTYSLKEMETSIQSFEY